MADNAQANNKDTADAIARLYATIIARRGADPKESYVAKLTAKGRHRMAKKVGEEGVEVALAAVDGGKHDVIAESADLFFHLLVLWAEMGVSPDEVYAKLREREGVSGLAEKAARVL